MENGMNYLNGVFKSNTANLPTSQTHPNQLGGTRVLIGDITTLTDTPTFIEFFKGNDSGSAVKTARVGVGYYGATEVNLVNNMDYTTGVHKYYDTTLNAHWLYMGTGNGFGLQFVPANNPNTGDIFNLYGCAPFKVEYPDQPTTGAGINGFSKVTMSRLSLVDITNTSTTTKSPAQIYNSNSNLTFLSVVGGITSFEGQAGIIGNLTEPGGVKFYQNSTNTNANLKLATGFTFPAANCAYSGISRGITTGYNVGAAFEAVQGGLNVGVIGKGIYPNNGSTNIGVIGVGDNTGTTPIYIGGFFGIGVPDNPTFTSSALIADNGSKSAPIFLARANGVTKLSITSAGVLKFDGNNATGTNTVSFGTNSPATILTAPYTWIDIYASDGTLCTMPIWKK